MPAVDFSNPLVVLLAILAVVLLLDLLMAGGGMTSSAACGVAGAMGTPVGWLGLLLVVALVLLAAGVPPTFDGDAGAWGVLGLLGLLLALGLVAFGVWRRDAGAPARPLRSPEERLRERYAAGALTRPQYQEALVDLLKDRYVRGELDVDEYEARLEHLLAAAPMPLQPREGEAGRPGPRHST